LGITVIHVKNNILKQIVKSQQKNEFSYILIDIL